MADRPRSSRSTTRSGRADPRKSRTSTHKRAAPAANPEKWTFAGALAVGGRAPKLEGPEFAFAGRSNVGKSSLINVLTRSHGLARTSGTPGRTQQINFFVGPGPIVFADLPGYGFARVPAAVQATWGRLVDAYLTERESLRGVVLIVDARRGMGDGDREALDLIRSLDRAVIVAVSKIDKLGSAERSRCLAAIGKEVADPIAFSARTREGERELWRRLTGLAALR